MSRCQSRSGVLFDHPCDNVASGSCGACGRPACGEHVRATSVGPRCVDCLRRALRDRTQRGSLAFLRDDPYFYWYFTGNAEHMYDEYDYKLFDQRAGEDDHAAEEAWEGS